MRSAALSVSPSPAPVRVLLHALPVVALVLVAMMLMSAPAQGAGADAGGSYIANKSSGRAYRLVVIGDSLASELADGLKWTFRRADNVVVRKKTKAGTGLVRTDTYNWPRAIRRLIKRKPVDIAVILIGGNDRQDMRLNRRRHKRFSDGWRKEYIQRLHNVAALLQRKGAAVYWVGLPVVKSRSMTRDYARLNRYFRHVATVHGIKFIDIRKLFATKSGGYDAFGKGLSGKVVKLRDGDGIHLSIQGSKKLGRYVGDRILADMPGRLTGSTTLSAHAPRVSEYVTKPVTDQAD